jgi:hypothetical protein
MTLHEIASKARKYIERKYGNPPHGGCLEASKHLARLLRKRGVQAKIVRGEFFERERANSWPHWWVRTGELLVDVTADQFDGEDEGIVVGPSKDLRRWVEDGGCFILR